MHHKLQKPIIVQRKYSSMQGKCTDDEKFGNHSLIELCKTRIPKTCKLVLFPYRSARNFLICIPIVDTSLFLCLFPPICELFFRHVVLACNLV